MGYDLHITRRDDWSDEGDDITSGEWLDVVRADPELKIDSRNGALFAVWCGPCKYGEGWFDWANGRIYTKNPDKRIVEKMIQIAKRLDALVQGDDGEIYEDTSQVPN